MQCVAPSLCSRALVCLVLGATRSRSHARTSVHAHIHLPCTLITLCLTPHTQCCTAVRVLALPQGHSMLHSCTGADPSPKLQEWAQTSAAHVPAHLIRGRGVVRLAALYLETTHRAVQHVGLVQQLRTAAHLRKARDSSSSSSTCVFVCELMCCVYVCVCACVHA